MRKIIICIFVFVACCATSSLCQRRDERTMQQRFRQAMNVAQFATYVDHTHRFTFPYPTFFTREDHGSQGTTHVQFGYHGHIDMVLECMILAQDKVKQGNGDFTVSGFVDRSAFYSFERHCVLHHGRWYVLSLIYPTDYQQAVERIRYRVRTWKPFEPCQELRLRYRKRTPQRNGLRV